MVCMVSHVLFLPQYTPRGCVSKLWPSAGKYAAWLWVGVWHYHLKHLDDLGTSPWEETRADISVSTDLFHIRLHVQKVPFQTTSLPGYKITWLPCYRTYVTENDTNVWPPGDKRREKKTLYRSAWMVTAYNVILQYHKYTRGAVRDVEARVSTGDEWKDTVHINIAEESPELGNKSSWESSPGST